MESTQRVSDRCGRGVAARFVVALTAMAALAAPARAQNADEIYKASAAAYKAGDYNRALKLLEQACSILPDERCDYNAGRIFEKMGRYKDAAARYKNTLSRAVSEEVREKAEERLRAILPFLPGRIEVRTDVAGAEVSIDGKAVGTTPMMPVELAAGDHEVVLRHPDYEDTIARVNVAPDQDLVVTLTPTRAVGTVVVNADVDRGVVIVGDGEPRETTFPARLMLPVGVHRLAVSAPGRGVEHTAVTVRKGDSVQVSVILPRPLVGERPAKPGGTKPVEVTTARVRPSVYRPWWGWAMLGGGVAVVVTGGVMTWMAEKDRSEVASAIEAIRAGRPPSMTMAEAARKEASGNDKAVASYVLYGIGGAASVAGAVILVLGLPTPATATIGPSLGDGAVVTVSGSF